MVRCQRTMCFALFVALLLQLDGSDGEAAQPGGYTLKDLEALVLEHDAGLMAMHERVSEVRSQLDETRSRFGPEFASYYSRYPSSGELQEEETNVQHWLSIGFRQDILQLLKIRPGRIDEMSAAVEGTEAELEETKRQAIYGLRKEYLDILEEKLKAEHFLELSEVYSEIFSVQYARYLHRTSLLPDLLLVQKELDHAVDALQRHMTSWERKRFLLADALGISSEEIVIRQPERTPPLPLEERLIDLAMRRRGEIGRLKANARMERARASTSAYEDVHVSSFVGYRLRDDGLSDPDYGLSVRLSLTIPLRFRGIKNNRHDRFMARERYWQSETERVRLEIKREIHQAYTDYILEQGRLDETVDMIALIEERLRVERLRLDYPVQSIDSDPVAIRQIEADLIYQKMRKEIARCRITGLFYELLHLAGLSSPEEIAPEWIDVASLTPDEVKTRNETDSPRSIPAVGTDPSDRREKISFEYHTESEIRSDQEDDSEILNENPVITREIDQNAQPLWAVQVTSTPLEEQAQMVLNALIRDGYHAYLSESSLNGRDLYRVRVGFFPSKQGAMEAREKISLTYAIPDVWVLLPSQGEIASN